MAKILVTVVGIAAKDPGKRQVTLGSKVLLKKEPSNAHDPHAIRVFLEDGVNSVGYVANSPTTIVKNTKSATDIHPMFEDHAYGVVVGFDKVVFRSGRESTAIIVELKLGQFVQGENSMKTITFKLVGSKTIYPNKLKLISEFNSGKTPYVKLFVRNNKIVAEFEGELAGYVDEKDQAGLSSYDEIVAAVGEERIAQITQLNGTNLIGQFTVNEAELSKEKSVRTLKSICQKIIDEGLATREEIHEKISYMEAYGVTEKQMIGVFGTYKAYDPEVAKRIPPKPKTLYQDGSGILKRVIGYMNMRRNLLFEGDRGVGKNVLTETLAWLYKRPLYEVSLNSQHDNTSLLGGKTIESDEAGRITMGFDKESIVEAAEVGGILVLDEFNTSLAHTMSLLNSLLDERRRIQVPGYRLVEADENFVAIATQNRDYQGTFENNEATIDRFVPIIFPKLENLKDVLIAKVPSVGMNVLNICDTLFKGIKKCVEDGEISEKAITIRGFVDACLATQADIPLKDALIDNVANRCTDLDDRKAILNMIEDIIG